MKKNSFHDYYEQIYTERWPSLSKALTENPKYHSLEKGLKSAYFLDGGSYLAASSLPLSPGGAILDMCAAPGGKTLVLAGRMDGSSSLVANEKSPARRRRLVRVLEEHLPEQTMRRIRITGHNAAKWGMHEQNAYDSILLDVPCSSERHILQSPKHLSQWSPARTKHLAIQAYAMLASSLMAAKPGGHILYSTCALSEKENDEVVAKLLRRKSEECRVVDLPLKTGEPTKYGIHILPDVCGGMGPIYYSLMQKT